jgi:acetyl-CoA carboxylase alpha subunit
MMDIKAVTLDEAKVVDQFLTEISFGAPGTIDAQYQTLSRLISFRSKVRQAIAQARQMATEQDQEHKEE